MPAHIIREFSEITKKDISLAGGKGASLGEMAGAGFQVPPGFVIIAQAFDRFLKETSLDVEVNAQLKQVNYQDTNSIDRAANVLHDLIHDARMPKDLENEILRHFSALGAPYVAVRSSATAEDSSVASWAGELETYLNTTKKNLIGNVKKCWASLFTPRAIVYRNEKGMRKSRVSVAVVIQKMVQAQVAGVAFTVHPVTRDKNQMIIEAGWGLGELLVQGQLTPDSYVLDKRDFSLLDVNVAPQKQGLFRIEGGNKLKNIPEKQREKQKLDGSQIRELARLCESVEAHYGFPCDVEWAYEGKQFYIVQSRPITTLK